MKWFFLPVLVLIISVNCFAQGHFTPAFSGNGNDQMTIYVLSAQVENLDLEAGDEVAIFDGSICCGVKILSQSFNFENDGSFLDIAASKADVGLSNGYTPGHLISYKFWDASNSKEITEIACQYFNPLVTPPAIIPAPVFSVGESAFVKLSFSAPQNHPPVANAGVDQSVNEGMRVTLDGSASLDADNDVLSYSWTAPDGIILSSTTAAKPTFTAPQVDQETNYTFSLIVNDGEASSIADQVTVSVKNTNDNPNSHFIPAFSGNGNDQMILYVLSAQVDNLDLEAGDEVAIFDGSICCGVKVLSQSFNFDKDGSFIDIPASKADAGLANGYTSGHLISYKFWDASNSKEITEIASQYFNPLVTPPAIISAPVFSVGESAFVKLSFSAPQNRPPVANAGVDQSVNEGMRVTLDGSASLDADNDVLSYLWTAPDGIILSSTTAAKPTFTAPQVSSVTNLTFTLVVMDGLIYSTADKITVTVNNIDHSPYVRNPINDLKVERNAPDQMIDLSTVFYDEDFSDQLAYSVSNTNSQVVVSTINGNNLILSFSTIYSGISNIEVTATSNGKVAKSSFTVEVKNPTNTVTLMDQKVLIYPNPVKDKIQLIFSGIPASGTWVTLSNMSGETVYKNLVKNKEELIMLNEIPSGIYILKIEQKTTKTYKIVVE